MIARLFLTLLVTSIPLVAGLQKIRPNLRKLDDLNDADAAMIADKHNLGVAAVMGMVDSETPLTEIADAVFEFMGEDEGMPEYDAVAMKAFAMAVFETSDDFTQALMAQTAALSDASPVMGAAYDVMSDLDNVGTVGECTDKVDAAAKKSGTESEMKLASISDAVAEASGEYWNGVGGGRRKLQLVPLVAIIIADVIGALIGFALGGIIGAIVLGILASVLAALQLGFPPFIC